VSAAEKALGGIGWRVAHTDPLRQAFHFERWIGRRRVAGVLLYAKTRAKAWTMLRNMLVENASEDAA